MMLYSMVLAIFVLPHTLAMPSGPVLLDEFENAESPQNLITGEVKQVSEKIEHLGNCLLYGATCCDYVGCLKCCGNHCEAWDQGWGSCQYK
ncbi:hypothetical protein BDV19DRAFT_282748 [Aspergillus venezuelensis]